MGFRNNICVVGAGQWGKNHIRTIDNLLALKGIVEPDQEVLQKVLNKYPGVSGHTNLSEALKEEYDGFTVATPAETHFAIAREIILSGKHVLVEKPMTFLSSGFACRPRLLSSNSSFVCAGLCEPCYC